MTFRSLSRAAIEAQLLATGRQFLASGSKVSQALIPIGDTSIDFGLDEYPYAAAGESRTCTASESFHYVIKGMVEYRNLDNNEVYSFKAGDFYVLTPGTRFVSRVKQDTRIVFAISPSLDRAFSEVVDPKARAWSEESLRATRLDYSGGKAPAANSLLPGASGAVIDDSGRLLMIQRSDSGYWTMPGGGMDIEDSLTSCVRREVKEETSIDVEVLKVIGTYSNPRNVVAYSDGELRREFTVLFQCKPVGGALKINHESIDGRWVSIENLTNLSMIASQRQRVEDVISFIKDSTTFIR